MKCGPRELYFISVKDIARICEVSEKTAKRWKAGTTCPPKPVLLLLAGDLGCFSPEWRGWVVRGDELISPEGWCITMADVRATPLQRAQIALYQAENRQLRAELERQDIPEEQPEPGEVRRFLGTT